MRIAWTLGGALFGRALFGKVGMVAGGILGYAISPPHGSSRSAATAADRPAVEAAASGERYPEETIIDAMRESEDFGESARKQEEVGSPLGERPE